MSDEGDRDIEGASRVLGIAFTPPERAQMVAGLARQRARSAALRAAAIPREVAPAMRFDPRLPGFRAPAAGVSKAGVSKAGVLEAGVLEAGAAGAGAAATLPDAGPMPADDAALALAPAWKHAAWLRAGALTSRRLTAVFLERIAARNATLLAYATVTGEAALAQADALDAHLAREGKPLGPLHGLPYGMKDIVDTAGIVTDWGAEPYRGRVPAEDAHVTTLLRAAGAVLLGKTAVGALAYGDLWYGGRTRNPWNEAEGASGSSAGSACAAAAGLCSFAIGTETYGSIVSPATRCRCVGLRPTFGRVSRRGVMALCPSLDKVGVLARASLDTALVMGVIAASDPLDAAQIAWPWTGVPAVAAAPRIGWRADELAGSARDVLEARGATLVELPARPDLPWDALGAILDAEAAASFVDLTDSDRDDALAWQDEAAWPNAFRRARFLSAVDHVQLDRLRRLAMEHVAHDLADVDAFASSPGLGPSLLLGNFTGHPCLSLPGWGAGSVSLLGGLFDEARLVALGMALGGG